MGKKLVKCGKKSKKWRGSLPTCETCLAPSNADPNLRFVCGMKKGNVPTCKAKCTNNTYAMVSNFAVYAGGVKLKMTCRCPKADDGNRACAWFVHGFDIDIWTDPLNDMFCTKHEVTTTTLEPGTTTSMP